jgi:hypothetical protein
VADKPDASCALIRSSTLIADPLSTGLCWLFIMVIDHDLMTQFTSRSPVGA